MTKEESLANIQNLAYRGWTSARIEQSLNLEAGYIDKDPAALRMYREWHYIYLVKSGKAPRLGFDGKPTSDTMQRDITCIL